MIDGRLDQRLAVASVRAVRQTMDELEELSGRIESEIDAKVWELQQIREDVKNKGNRRVAELTIYASQDAALTMRRNEALRAAKRGEDCSEADCEEPC